MSFGARRGLVDPSGVRTKCPFEGPKGFFCRVCLEWRVLVVEFLEVPAGADPIRAVVEPGKVVGHDDV